jgi:preprotein translocase subunit SecG
MTIGTGLFIDLGATTNWAKIIIFQIVTGLGAGPLFQGPMIAFQSHLPQRDIAAASSASMFLRNLSSSMSIVIGSVLLQKDLHGSQLTTEAESRGSATEYASAMRIMWIFYTAMAGLMTFMTLFIEKMTKQDKSDTQSTGSDTVAPAERHASRDPTGHKFDVEL